jgi:hypothetical protein
MGLPMWLILQLLIMFAVLASNVHWGAEFTGGWPQGFAIAYSLPWVLGKVLDFWRRHKLND